MATHKWEFTIKGVPVQGAVLVTAETFSPEEVDWSITWPADYMVGTEASIFACEILRLAEENAKLIEGGRIMLKAFSILASTAWESFREGIDFEHDALREELEAAGLIEMLPDQTWSLTELGGRVCRREQ